jgi:hypothetical protein
VGFRTFRSVDPKRTALPTASSQNVPPLVTKYGLVVTLKTANVNLDVYTPVDIAVRTPIEIENPI